MKKKKFGYSRNEFNDVKEMGYMVHEFTPWHFRVYKKGSMSNITVDIFPTTRVFTMYKNGDYIGKGIYDGDITKLVETKIDTFAQD